MFTVISITYFFVVSRFVMECLAFCPLQYREIEKCIHISQLLKPIIDKRNAAILRSFKRKKNVCYFLIISIV